MGRPRLAVTIAALLLASVATSLATAAPPRPGTEDNGLTENESAPLWSRDDDSNYISNAEYRDAYGEDRTTIHQIANGTDLTYKRPPGTAATWTRHDHLDFEPGNDSTSVYPAGTNTTDSRIIQDAHASIFSVGPSTIAHVDPNETRQYVAPEGTLRGAVDYRVEPRGSIPIGRELLNATVLDHEITEVRVRQDGRVIAREEGTHWPVLDYDLQGSGSTDLTLEADIQTRVEITHAAGPNGTDETLAVRTDSVTVSETIPVRVYALDPQVHYARYPDGDVGVALFQRVPWQGFDLTTNGSLGGRGVWRFYTARDTEWDVLTESRANGSRNVSSPALPVAVHSYPSTLGPRVAPVGPDIDLVEVWGETREPPASLGEHVTIDVVTERYELSYGVATRSTTVDREAITVRGIVRGVSEEATPVSTTERTIRTSDLTAEIVSQDEDGVTVRLTLTDGETGEPIWLDEVEDPRFEPVVGDRRSGHIRFAGGLYETNTRGTVEVNVDDPGVYTARYEPGSWLTHDPAYVGDSATIRWHPLTTIDGWAGLLGRSALWFLPFVLALVAGRSLGRMFRYGGPP